jgi:hypothetical protein
MNAIQIPEQPITLVLAAKLLADAVTPGNPDAARWSMNALLEAAQSGKLRGRNPLTLAPVDVADISPADYASLMVLSGDDLRKIAAERDIRIAGDDAVKTAAAHHAKPATLVEPGPTATAARLRTRRDLMKPVIEAAQCECKDKYDAAEVWTVLVRKCKEGCPPMFGRTEDGIQWTDSEDGTRIFSRKNLNDRLRNWRDKAR